VVVASIATKRSNGKGLNDEMPEEGRLVAREQVHLMESSHNAQALPTVGASAREEAYQLKEQRRAAERERRLARRQLLVRRLQGEGLVFALAAVCVVIWVSSPYFLTIGNLLTAASVMSVLGIMAVAETLIVISGEIDISVGSVMALMSVLIGVMVIGGMNVWVAAILAFLCAGGIGAINGIITVYFKVNSLVTTLGTTRFSSALLTCCQACRP
jgi:hypothetical protein